MLSRLLGSAAPSPRRCSASATGPAVSSTCQGRAPYPESARLTVSGRPGCGGSQLSRRSASGASRFSTGSRLASAMAVTAARAAARRAAAAGSRSAQRCAGGGPFGTGAAGGVGQLAVGAGPRAVDRGQPAPSRASWPGGPEAADPHELPGADRKRPGRLDDRRIGQDAPRRQVRGLGDLVPGRSTARGRRRARGAIARGGSRTCGATGPPGPSRAWRRAPPRTPGGPTRSCPARRVPRPGRRATRSAPRRRVRRTAGVRSAGGGPTSRPPNDPSPGGTRAPPRPACRGRPWGTRAPAGQFGVEESPGSEADLGETGQVL